MYLADLNVGIVKVKFDDAPLETWRAKRSEYTPTPELPELGPLAVYLHFDKPEKLARRLAAASRFSVQYSYGNGVEYSMAGAADAINRVLKACGK